MAKKSEYRESLADALEGAKSECINTIETDVNNILEFAEGVDVDDAAEMGKGLETIIADLKALADKLY